MELKGLSIEVVEKDNGVIFRLNGDIKTDIYSDFLGFFKQKVEKANMIMDFTHVNYMSSSGVGALFNLDKVARENNKKFMLFGLNPSVKKIIELTKLYDKFLIYQTEDEAVKQLN
ncbi:MAG: STAS domain-containing protein [Spirochaetes bacterium]|nr:STAS domain-containing protein [Spirochaetota bacterium]